MTGIEPSTLMSEDGISSLESSHYYQGMLGCFRFSSESVDSSVQPQNLMFLSPKRHSACELFASAAGSNIYTLTIRQYFK